MLQEKLIGWSIKRTLRIKIFCIRIKFFGGSGLKVRIQPQKCIISKCYRMSVYTF